MAFPIGCGRRSSTVWTSPSAPPPPMARRRWPARCLLARLLCLAAALARAADQRARLRALDLRRPHRLNPSSIVDMKMWVLNGLALAGGYGYLAFGNVFCRDATLAGLNAGFGARPPAPGPRWTVLAMATLFELLAYELAYWFGHFLFHRIPALWEFHKVHHSAEVMTTFTELRQHPVEILAFMNLIAIATGAVFGVMTYAFGPGVQPFTLLNGNILLMLFLVTYGHSAPQPHVDPVHRRRRPHPAEPGASPDPPFRQSRALGQEPRLRAGGVGLGVRHALHPGVEREKIRFGVGPTEGEFSTVPRNYLLPFVRFGEHVGRGLRRFAPHRAAPACAARTAENRFGGSVERR